MGGNDAALVLPGSDIAAIAEPLFWAGFMNNGQICGDVKRVYVHRSQHADMVEALASIARSVTVGDPFDDGVRLGPVSTHPQFNRVVELLDNALANGARAASGGAPLDRPGFFLPPTILDNVDDGFQIVDEEQFGPVLPIISFRDVADAIARANRSEYGLTASVWSGDADHAAQLAPQFDAGQVSINVHGGGTLPHLPFGGHKHSGIGVENGPWGLHGFTELQAITGPSRL